MICVVGGVYDERCIQPRWDQFFGSAGRAAAALASLGEVTLVTYVADRRRRELEARAASFGRVRLEATSHPNTVSFDYVHPLSVPVILPPPQLIAQAQSLRVEADIVLRFGMMEGDAVVRAKRAVYDPQSAFAPAGFRQNGSVADDLAIVANAYEVELMTHTGEVEAGARKLLVQEGASVVVVKRGSQGALVLASDGSRTEVPAYRSELVFGIGSGDIFAAAFAHHWGETRRPPGEAAELASKAAAWYCGSRSAPLLHPADVAAMPWTPTSARPGRVYLAGPFFSMSQRWLVEEARTHLIGMGLEVFSPLHEVGVGPANVVAPADLKGLDECDRVFALADGADPGTLFEVGFAHAKGLPIVVLSETLTDEQLKMLVGSGCQHTDDFATAVYFTAWTK